MNRYKKYVTPIDPRIRKITGSFSWIDHCFVSKGWIDLLEPAEILLYFWLVAVGDRFGVSFYSIEKTADKLKLSTDRIEKARSGLIGKKLIAFKNGIYQVLPLTTRNKDDS